MKARNIRKPRLRAPLGIPEPRCRFAPCHPLGTPSIQRAIGCGCSSGVERNLAKVGVEGSNPFARSKIPVCKMRHAGRHGRPVVFRLVGRGGAPEAWAELRYAPLAFRARTARVTRSSGQRLPVWRASAPSAGDTSASQLVHLRYISRNAASAGLLDQARGLEG